MKNIERIPCRNIIVLMVLIGGGIMLLPSCEPGAKEKLPLEKVAGRIFSPLPATQYPTAKIKVAGRIVDLPKNYLAFLMVSKKDTLNNPIFWPKTQINSFDGAGFWEVNVFEDGPKMEPFALNLFILNENGKKQIDDWYEKGSKTGSFPPLTYIHDGILLYTIDSLMIAN